MLRQPAIGPIASATTLFHTASDTMSSRKGAAEEPEPEPDGASSSPPSAASYDPSVYQPPHPDDRGGKKKKSATTKPRTKSTKTAKNKTEDTAKGKEEDDDGSHRCANCDKPGAKSKCGRCGVEWYCGRECQKVRGWAGRVTASRLLRDREG